MRSKILLLEVFAALLAAAPAYAHTGANAVFSLSSGFLHPLGGLYHLLAMFAVGLLAAQLGGRALWLVPVAFAAMMIAGALIGVAAVDLLAVEYGISLSLVVDLPVALALNMPAAVAMMLVGFFCNRSRPRAWQRAAGGRRDSRVCCWLCRGHCIDPRGGYALVTKGVPARMAATAVSMAGLAFLLG